MAAKRTLLIAQNVKDFVDRSGRLHTLPAKFKNWQE
jgi:hypothetical protein